MKRSLFAIIILSGILSICAYGGHGCEGEREHCDVRCSRKHPRSIYNRERCFNRCEERFDLCRGHYYPVEPFAPYPPVIVEPYPLFPWWGRGWGHHPHHHHWR